MFPILPLTVSSQQNLCLSCRGEVTSAMPLLPWPRPPHMSPCHISQPHHQAARGPCCCGGPCCQGDPAATGTLLPQSPPCCLTGSSSPGSAQKALDMLWKPFAQLLIRTALVCKLEPRTPSSSCSFLMYLKGPGNLWQDNAEHSTYL